jgi:NAD(P)-dependent dehydrogenase (short-subunit alcohol dehydrogenase family)
MSWTAMDIPDRSGREAIVAGANTGRGHETSLELAGASAEVVVAASLGWSLHAAATANRG